MYNHLFHLFLSPRKENLAELGRKTKDMVQLSFFPILKHFILKGEGTLWSQVENLAVSATTQEASKTSRIYLDLRQNANPGFKSGSVLRMSSEKGRVSGCQHP